MELITNKLNNDAKPLNMLFNKGLYRGIIFAVILVFLIFFFFKEKINDFLIQIMKDNNMKKKNLKFLNNLKY